jgi:predicted ATPase
LAWAKGKSGNVEHGLELLNEASISVRDQHLWDAEMHRQRGELLLLKDAPKVSKDFKHGAYAEACFLQAIELARKQNAKSLELRAAASLSRLWATEGKRTEARDLLANIYGWFIEGFDTPDLQEAKELLDTLR